MSFRILLLAGAALAVAATANAKEKIKHKEKHVERTCVCSMSGPGGHEVMVAPVPPAPEVPGLPPHSKWHMELPHHPGGPQVYAFRGDGDHDEDRVIVIRKNKRFRDSADANEDGKVTRREFLKRAEKHYKERDRNGDGELDESELEHWDFAVPRPPRPPAPPAPPAPDED